MVKPFRIFVPFFAILILNLIHGNFATKEDFEDKPDLGSRKLNTIIDPYGLLVLHRNNLSEEEDDHEWKTGFIESERRSPPFESDHIEDESFLAILSQLVTSHIGDQTRSSDVSADTGQGSPKAAGLWTAILTGLGIDSDRFDLLTMNFLYSIGQMISSQFVGTVHSDRRGIDELIPSLVSLLDGKQSQFLKLRDSIEDPTLPLKLIQSLEDNTGNATVCLQLLVCKVSPLIWTLQNVAGGKGKKRVATERPHPFNAYLSVLKDLHEGLPDLNEFLKFSKTCEADFPFCQLVDFA